MSRKNNSSIWMTIYSDLVTNLMFFFLAAWIISRVDDPMRNKISNAFRDRVSKTQIMQPEKEDIARELKEKLKTSQGTGSPTATGYSQIEIIEKTIKITLPGDISFASGSSLLSEGTKDHLHEVAGILKRTSNPVIIEGYTDDVPMTTGSNWELSLARAISVVDYLSSSEGIPRNRLMAAGYGEFKPLVPNTSPENRKKNRRIEITVVRYE